MRGYSLVVGAVVTAAALAPPAHGTSATLDRRSETPRNVRWHGGPVQHHPRVYVILWGPRWSRSAARRGVRKVVLGTIRALRGSSYQHLLTQYYDRAGYVTGDVRLAGVWHDRTTPRGDLINHNRGVRHSAKEVARAVAVNGWRHSFDAQYLLLLQSPQGGGYCARNVNRSLRGERFVFSIFPWLGKNHSGCGGTSLDEAYESTVSHEYAEMVTDPLANAWARGDPAGHNYEIADICNSDAHVHGVWMQKIWSNRLRRCAA